MTLPGAYGPTKMALQVMRAHVLPPSPLSNIISKGGLLNGAGMCVHNGSPTGSPWTVWSPSGFIMQPAATFLSCI